MAGEVDDDAEQVVAEIPDADGADLRIDRSRVAHDLGVAGAGVREGEAALHAYAAVERDLVLMAYADGEASVDARGVSEHDRLDDLPFQELRETRVGND